MDCAESPFEDISERPSVRGILLLLMGCVL